MELSHLRYFANVARTGSFTEGARLSHVSTPAMSKAIKRLEDELDAELLARSTRRVVLTETGEILLTHCETIFHAVDALMRDLEDLGTSVSGTLRVGAMEVFSIYLLPRAIAALSEKYPRLVTKSFEMHPEAMEQRLLDGELDVGFTVGGSASPKLESVELGRTHGCIVCGRSHPLYAGGRIEPDDVTGYRFVVPEFLGREHSPRIDLFPDDRYPRPVGATIELLQMGIALTVSGAFLGYFPEVVVREHLADGTLRELAGMRAGPEFVLTRLTRRGPRPKLAARHLTEALQATIAND
jgi:DNA-binding transcriptional LysR family regulator